MLTVQSILLVEAMMLGKSVGGLEMVSIQGLG
jgi:hypothetical protein